MIKFKKSIICILLSSLVAMPLAGCQDAKSNLSVKPEEMNIEASGVIDSNDTFTLTWDEERTNVLLENKENQDIWSTVPYEFSLTDETNINLNAPMFINYYNPSDNSLTTAKAYADCIELGNFSAKSEDKILRMDFYFNDAEILVPLEISLTEYGMQARVNAKDIKESGKTMLIDISVLPYFCSTPNSNDESSYLFVPTGSGALLYTDEDIQEFSRSYTAEVYGTDAARHILDNTTDEEPIRLPVYGVKNKDSAMFAIISQGAESAKITADAGNSRNGYSTVYATFSVRGNDETEVERTSYSDALIYSEAFDKSTVYAVDYYPLYGEDADYNGMAELYKKYLTENGLLEDGKLSQMPYNLTFLGGFLVRDVAVGVPYTRMQSATTFNQAESMISQLTEKTGITPSVLLEGFCKDGTDIGRIAGGYGFSSKLGGKKDYKTLNEYCKKNGIPLFAEYDLVQFNSSSNGFSTSFDIAKTAGKQLAAFYPLRINIRNQNENLKKYGLLQRSLLETATEKLIDKCDYVSGFSLSTLGSIAYSDFSSEEYYVKAGMAEQVQKLIKSVKAQGYNVNIGGANGYSAGVCDSVTDVPSGHGDYFAFDREIPFYQMIFHGNTAMYSTPVNLSADSAEDVLYAIESGVSPNFVLTAKPDTVVADTLSDKYYASVYEGNKDFISLVVSETADYYKKIGDLNITKYTIVDDSVSVTEFSDGSTVTVNRSEKEANVNGTVLDAMSFCYLENGNSHSFSFSGGEQ